MAALVQSGTMPLQVGLAHLFYNLFGVIAFYPLPITRRIPLDGARFLGRMTRISKAFIFIWIAVAFILIPILLLLLSYMFESDLIAVKVLASVITIVVGCLLIWLGYWLKFRNGKQKIATYYNEREARRAVYKKVPEDITDLKEKVSFLMGERELNVVSVEDEKFMQKEQDEEEGEIEA